MEDKEPKTLQEILKQMEGRVSDKPAFYIELMTYGLSALLQTVGLTITEKLYSNQMKDIIAQIQYAQKQQQAKQEAEKKEEESEPIEDEQ